MSSSSDSFRRNRWFWWGVLAFLAFGLPPFSLLIVGLLKLLPLGNSVNLPIEVIASNTILGTATALSLVSNLVIFGFLTLHDGKRWSRLLAAAGYLSVHLLISLIALAGDNWHWITQLTPSNGDFRSLIAYLFLPPTLSCVAIAPATTLRLFRGWTITRSTDDPPPAQVDLLTLFEWVLISAIIFVFARWSIAMKLHHGYQVLFYDLILVAVPAIGLGIITMILFRWMLASIRMARNLHRLLAIILIHASVYAIAVSALHRFDDQVSFTLTMQQSAAPLSTCIVGTIYIVAICDCLRRLGYRLITSS